MQTIENKIKKLPTDIINHIIPYTYQFQNKILLDDIKNYDETKKKLFQLYYNFWINHLGLFENEDKWWLINNILSHINNYQATMYGHIENFYNIFFRHTKLNTFKDVDKYLLALNAKSVNTQINVVWGLLLPKERNDIIIIFKEENII